MGKRKLFLFVFIAALLLSLASCGKNPANDSAEPPLEPSTSLTDDQAEQSADDEREEISLLPGVRISVPGVLDITPGQSGSNTWIWDGVFDSLLYMDPSEPENIKGCLAESWTHSDDFLTWTFTIKDGVMFSDGTDCDAAAIAEYFDLVHFAPYKFNMNMLYGEYRSEHASLSRIESVEAAGDNELVISLSSPCAWFETELCLNSFRVISPTAYKLYGSNDMRASVGSGPYVVEEFVQYSPENMRTWLILRANPDYHMAERAPKFESITLTDYMIIDTVKDYMTSDKMSELLLEGECDISQFSDLSLETPKYVYVEDGHKIKTLYSTSTSSLWFNPVLNKAFEDINVRKAINRIIDLDELNSVVYGGYGQVQTSIWAEGTPSCLPFDGYYYDAEEGHALLAEAGLSAADIELEILQSVGSLYGVPTLQEQIAAQLTAAGINTTVTRVEITMNTITANCRVLNIPGTFALSYSAGAHNGLSPNEQWRGIMEPYVEKDYSVLPRIGSMSGSYKLSWQELYDPELYEQMCEIYERMISTPHWDEMISCSRELTRITQEDYAAIPLVRKPTFFAVREGAEEAFEALCETSMFKWLFSY